MGIAEIDDWIDPSLLETLVNRFKSNDVALFYAQSHRVNKDGIIKGNWISQAVDFEKANLFSEDFVMNGDLLIKDFLI